MNDVYISRSAAVAVRVDEQAYRPGLEPAPGNDDAP